MQLRHATALTFEEYVTGEGWKDGKIVVVPGVRRAVTSHGTYVRKLPKPARIARFYCRPCRMTISLLPDFYASRTPGLLEDIEEVVAVAESARSWRTRPSAFVRPMTRTP